MSAARKQTLRDMIRDAGFDTQKDFASSIDMDPAHLSKLCSGNGDRRATAANVRAIAARLGKTIAEMVPVLVHEDELAHDLLREFAGLSERNQQLEELLRETTQSAGLIHDHNNELERQCQQARACVVAAEQREREMTRQMQLFEDALRDQDRLLHEAHNLLEASQQAATQTDRQRAREIAELNERIEQNRKNEVIKTVLTGMVGIAVGAVIHNAAT